MTLTAISMEPASTGCGRVLGDHHPGGLVARLRGRRHATLDDVRHPDDRQPGRLGKHVRPRSRRGHRPQSCLALGGSRVGHPEREPVHARRSGAQGAIDDIAEAGEVADRDLDDVRELVSGQHRRLVLAVVVARLDGQQRRPDVAPLDPRVRHRGEDRGHRLSGDRARRVDRRPGDRDAQSEVGDVRFHRHAPCPADHDPAGVPVTALGLIRHRHLLLWSGHGR